MKTITEYIKEIESDYLGCNDADLKYTLFEIIGELRHKNQELELEKDHYKSVIVNEHGEEYALYSTVKINKAVIGLQDIWYHYRDSYCQSRTSDIEVLLSQFSNKDRKKIVHLANNPKS